MGRGRSKLILVFALVMGVVTAGLVWSYTQRLQGELKQRAAQEETVTVVVAARDIAVRTKLSSADLKTQQVPKSVRLSNAFSDTKQVEGRITKLPIAAGEQVLTSKIAGEREESGLTFIIPPGKRAVAVKVSEVISSGGLILPGDRVDVVGVFDKRDMGKDMSAFILQNIEVLAVAQFVQGEPTEQSLTEQAKTATQGQATKGEPKPQRTDPKAAPQAKTVTLAVSPEEAQRLILAEERGVLRLALRPFNEGNLVTLPEATLQTIREPLRSNIAQITSVKITPTNAKPGDTLRVEITVKNTSNETLKTQGPTPEFTYVQGQTFYSQNFASQPNTYRIGLNLDGQASAPFPYRWGLGGDLPPGATTTVVGFIKLTHDLKPTSFWAGLIQEPANVVQDNVGMTMVTVLPANVAVIAVDSANVRSGPTVDASIIGELAYGTQVPIVGVENDWYKIKLPNGKDGFVAAGWITTPATANSGG
ncbi:MAG: Flp pilus assembly protein CpaB [Chloroflexi bacterium]|nr:Flp pilus assembly protein CpaB [Chloroflexota bacterium]